MATWTTARTARKRHVCATGLAHYPVPCKRTIQPGERYLEHRAAPGHVGNEHWWTARECLPCAETRGYEEAQG